MLRPFFTAEVVFFGMVVLVAGAAHGQAYPVKPIRIFTSSVGGGNDFTARQIAQGASGPLGQPVVVENRGGAVISAEIVSKAAPDGYSLIVAGSSLWINKLLRSDLPYEMADFVPITVSERGILALAVHPSLPVKSVKELIAFAKERPGQINYASSGPGGSTHLSAELFKSMTGVNIVNIQHKGGVAAIQSVMSGDVHLMIGDSAQVAPHVKSGRLRVLGITSATPSELAPGVPPIASTVPGFEWIGTTLLWAPAKTPSAIISRLNQEVVRTLVRPDIKELFLAKDTEVVANTPEQAAAMVKSEIARTAKAIKDAGVKVQ